MVTSEVAPEKARDETRRRILDSAFREFYHHGFQGGSLSNILEAAGSSKGALFHHFANKGELGYAVVDEIVQPLLLKRWLEPLEGSVDPVADLKRSFPDLMRQEAAMPTGLLMLGCPLNNLAQEMSPLDEGFRTRTCNLYSQWRAGVAAALRRGIEAGNVRADVVPESTATFIVAAQTGIIGAGKNSQSREIMLQAVEGFCRYLDTLKP